MSKKPIKHINFFLKDKPVNILLEIHRLKENSQEIFPSILYKNTDTTLSHITKVLKQLIKYDLVKDEGMQGRKRVLSLTNKGEQVVSNIKNILQTMG